MKSAAFSLSCLLSLVATCALYGWLESTANLVEGVRLLFAPGATTVIFAPLLLLFIALEVAVFFTIPMIAAAIGAAFGGLVLRKDGVSVSRLSVWTAAGAAFLCHLGVIIFVTRFDAALLPGRPRQHPKTPAYALACVAGVIGAVNSYVAASIIRRLTAERKPRSPVETSGVRVA